MSQLRIIPAHLAHSLSNEQPCGAQLRFPGDSRAVVCRFTNGDHDHIEWHEDETATRRWRRVGYDSEGMVKPGSVAQ